MVCIASIHRNMPLQGFLSQVFAQVTKEYLGPASSSSSVSARNILSGIRNLQRRSFYQNSFKDLPSDPKSQASTAAQSPMPKVCVGKSLFSVLMGCCLSNWTLTPHMLLRPRRYSKDI